MRLSSGLRSILFCGMGLLLCCLPAQGFDRIAAGTQYRQWLAQLKTDIGTLQKNVPTDREITQADVEHWCAQSVVPGSRGVINITSWLNLSRHQPAYSVSGEIVFSGPMVVLMRLLEQEIPAGDGGLFPEAAGSSFPDHLLHVVYMHVHSSDSDERFFSQSDTFKPYHLPLEGQLERQAYPFLLFEQNEARWRFGGISAEWWAVAQYFYNVQFF